MLENSPLRRLVETAAVSGRGVADWLWVTLHPQATSRVTPPGSCPVMVSPTGRARLTLSSSYGAEDPSGASPFAAGAPKRAVWVGHREWILLPESGPPGQLRSPSSSRGSETVEEVRRGVGVHAGWGGEIGCKSGLSSDRT